MRDIRFRRVTPHVAQKQHSAIDGRTMRHVGYVVSLRLRKRVEEIFGRMKTVGGSRRTRYRGVARIGLAGYLVATAYNRVRMAHRPLGPLTPGCPQGAHGTFLNPQILPQHSGRPPRTWAAFNNYSSATC